MKAERFLLVNDAAKALKVCNMTIRIWEKEGRLKAERTPGGVRLFSSAEVERFRTERERRKSM